MTSIEVSTTVSALHSWPGAPDRRDYLRTPHWHKFRISLEVEVGHSDRQVEFHDLREELEGYMGCYRGSGAPQDWGHMSCEMMAKQVFASFSHRYTVLTVKVYEDEDHGAILRRD
jgi:hypothetical protein